MKPHRTRTQLRLGLVFVPLVVGLLILSLRPPPRPMPTESSPAREVAAAPASATVPADTGGRGHRPPRGPVPELRDAMERWKTVSPFAPMAAFQAWVGRYESADAAVRDTLKAEGVRLAQERRAALKELIQRDPEQALASTVPEGIRQQLPPEVTRQLEKRVDGRGELRVTAMTSGDPASGRPSVLREAILAGESYQAYVYGMREAQPSRWDIPLHGIEVDRKLAVSEFPGRLLEPAEAAAAKPLGADPLCSVSQQPVSSLGTPTAIVSGDHSAFFCGRLHAAAELRSLQEQEALLPPGFRSVQAPVVNAASGGAGTPVPTILPDGDASWTTGSKRAVIVPLTFHGDDLLGMNYDEYSEMATRIDDAWNRWSYGRCRLKPVGGGSHVVAPLDLDGYSPDYSEDDISGIWSDAEDWADDHGYPPDSYDLLIVLAGDANFTEADTGDGPPPTVWWTGMGRVGGRYSIMRVTGNNREDRISANTWVALHELGHNLGLLHASSLFTTPKLVASIGSMNFYTTSSEYGDLFDKMGHGADDYNVHYKNWLHWLGDSEVPMAMSEGKYVIHEHDLGEHGGGARGLQVPFAPGLVLLDSLFVEYRLYNTDNALFTSGPTIRLGSWSGPKSYLLDGRPETPNDGSTDKDIGTWDSQLPPGRTFSFTRYGLQVHLTTLSADPDAGTAEMMVRFGTPAGNHAPTGNILEWSAGAAGQTVYFTADASDADGDDLAYYWEVQDSTDSLPADPTVGYVWKTTGLKTIRCTVSDMHGGVTTLTHTINIVPNIPPSIALAKTASTDEDTPLDIDFTVSDPTLDPSAIAVTATSLNLSVVAATGVKVTPQGGGKRRLTVTPSANQHGVVSVVVTASDGQKQSSARIDITVRAVTPGITLVPAGDTWSYWDAATPPDANWVAPGYRDVTWKRDTARFVYNQGVFIPSGWTALADAPGRITTYFRQTFSVPATLTGSLTLQLLCDDGAVVYLNGTEVWRQNMPDGDITPTTPAVRSIEGTEESAWTLIPLSNASLKPGVLNSIAVEVHDRGGRGILSGRGAGDVSFDAFLALLQAPTVPRLPNRVFPEDTVLGPISIGASDSESPPGALEITGTSSDQTVIADSGVFIGYNKVQGYFFKLFPQTNASGTATITLRVSDGASVTTRAFGVTVTPVNDPPTVDPIAPVVVALGQIPELVRIVVNDVDNSPASLQVHVTSGNIALVPNSGLELLPGATPGERLLRITPTPGLFAQATLTVSVSDGSLSGSTSFLFRVSEAVPSSSVTIPLVESGALWRYWAQALPTDAHGSPIDWTDPRLADRAWPSGVSQLGYGGNGERTVVPIAPYRVTTYFRRAFTIPNLASLSKLHLRLLRDDGAVVYLNGSRVYASNMPRGVALASTLAATDVSGAAEQTWVEADLPLANAVSGRNVLAVEIHQSALPTALAPGDLSFDLELEGTPAPSGSESVLVPQGALWSYWDSSQYPTDQWRDGSFPANSWPQGLARLGFGMSGLTTLLADGFANFRAPSILLRHEFDVSDPSFYSALHLLLQRDDGAVVWLNGVRVLNDNVASTALVTDWALSEVPAPDQTQWRHFLLDPKQLVRGRNLLAVELHQASQQGTDLNFDAQLSATLGSGSPPLFIRAVPAGYELSWPAEFEDWILQSSPSMAPGSWNPVAATRLSVDDWIYVTQPPPAPGQPTQYFRLASP